MRINIPLKVQSELSIIKKVKTGKGYSQVRRTTKLFVNQESSEMNLETISDDFENDLDKSKNHLR